MAEECGPKANETGSVSTEGERSVISEESEGLDPWFLARAPKAPAAIVHWFDGIRFEEGVDHVDRLVEEGMRALREAIERPGRNRDAAFDLLRADGFFSFACEAAAEKGLDPDGLLEELETVLSRIQAISGERE